MVNRREKSKARFILGLMVVVLALFVVSEFLDQSLDNRSKAAENYEQLNFELGY